MIKKIDTNTRIAIMLMLLYFSFFGVMYFVGQNYDVPSLLQEYADSLSSEEKGL